MLSKIAERRAALDQQMKDITMVQLELESAEIRCRQALEELNEKGHTKHKPKRSERAVPKKRPLLFRHYALTRRPVIYNASSTRRYS
ncbi:hypothetical protein HORIV_28300 [Vreelandella olivaria]|uniref:Uncharacterized protein n=1 Tax=Vreelandella olivaria TaxID=390919 RepID=A0ABN5WU40_9GAMM|nr:hypothetical protein HORIV_28300 [Halomonas olivaria]